MKTNALTVTVSLPAHKHTQTQVKARPECSGDVYILQSVEWLARSTHLICKEHEFDRR